MVSESLKKLDIKSVKLSREGDNLLITKNTVKYEAMIDEGGYGFEPSLYVFNSDSDAVCKIVEDLATSMREMA